MRRLLLGLSVLALVTLPANAPPATAATRNVTIADNTFQPDDVTIAVGDTVTWRHTGQRPHSVQADDGSFNSSPGCSFENTSPCMHNGATFSFTATRAGTIFYHCAVHGSARGVGMAGSITVASSSTSSTAPPTTSTTARPTTTTARPATTTTRAAGATTTAAPPPAGGGQRPPDPPLPSTTVDPDDATSTTIPLAPATTLAAPAGDDDDDGPPMAIILALVVLAAALAGAAFYYRPRRGPLPPPG